MTTPRSRPRKRQPKTAKPEPAVTDSERARRLAARGLSRRAIERKLQLSRQAVNVALQRSSKRGRPPGNKHARLHVLTDAATVAWLRALARELGVSVGEVLRRMRVAMTAPTLEHEPRPAADGGA
jgi:hypothetical protein